MEGKDSGGKTNEGGQKAQAPKFSHVVEGPIEISETGDPDKIGKHYTALHKAKCGEAYKILGENVKVRYEKERLDNGKVVVNVIADHY